MPLSGAFPLGESKEDREEGIGEEGNAPYSISPSHLRRKIKQEQYQLFPKYFWQGNQA